MVDGHELAHRFYIFVNIIYGNRTRFSRGGVIYAVHRKTSHRIEIVGVGSYVESNLAERLDFGCGGGHGAALAVTCGNGIRLYRLESCGNEHIEFYFNRKRAVLIYVVQVESRASLPSLLAILTKSSL